MKSYLDGKFGTQGVGGLMIVLLIGIFVVLAQALGWRTEDGVVPVLLLRMTAMSQGNTLADILKWEQSDNYSREAVVIAGGQDLALGAVVGKITKSCPTTGTAAAGNSGGGTVASVTAGLKAKLGQYQIKCLTYVASPLAATFEVTDPDGLRLPDATLAAYVSDAINFDIADGSPVIAVGDIWTIDIAAGSGKIKEIDFDAVDGTQDAYGIVIAAYDASLPASPLTDIDGVAIVRDAKIVAANLVWPTTSPAVSAAQKAAALAQLAAKGIIETTLT
jgi:hypothetical protein